MHDAKQTFKKIVDTPFRNADRKLIGKLKSRWVYGRMWGVIMNFQNNLFDFRNNQACHGIHINSKIKILIAEIVV